MAPATWTSGYEHITNLCILILLFIKHIYKRGITWLISSWVLDEYLLPFFYLFFCLFLGRCLLFSCFLLRIPYICNLHSTSFPSSLLFLEENPSNIMCQLPDTALLCFLSKLPYRHGYDVSFTSSINVSRTSPCLK